MALAAIARVTGVSEKWLYVNQKYAEIPQEVTATKKSPDKLTIECDEIWSFVQNNSNGYGLLEHKKLWDAFPPNLPAMCTTPIFGKPISVFFLVNVIRPLAKRRAIILSVCVYLETAHFSFG